MPLVPTKRGSHLALSLERLEALCGRPLQRIGLSATQRPLDEVARFLGGAEGTGVSGAIEPQIPFGNDNKKSKDNKTSNDNRKSKDVARVASVENEITVDGSLKEADTGAAGVRYRPVTIVNAGARKVLELTVEVPVEDMAKLGVIDDLLEWAGVAGSQSVNEHLAEHSSAAVGDCARANLDTDFCERAACGREARGRRLE